MKDHLSFEELSAYFDGESSGVEIETHVAGCAACRASLASFQTDRLALRAAWTAPPLPAQLRRTLLETARQNTPVGSRLGRILQEFRRSLRLPLAAVAGAAAVALLLWTRGADWFSPRLEIPADLFIAAHNQYELTLPLAPTEKILVEMPRGLALSIDARQEKDSDVY